MRNYATAQQTGTYPVQFDATAVHTAPGGARAYVLLDGVGHGDGTAEWTRTAARRLARAASRRADAEAGLRSVYNRYAAERAETGARYLPKAAAVVAVVTPGRLSVAWCGDARAYSIGRDQAVKLTNDHNLHRVYPPCATYPQGGARNHLTSCLGSTATDEDVRNMYGHPAIEAVTRHSSSYRLLLASDGAYEPNEGCGLSDASAAVGTPGWAARAYTDLAVSRAVAASRAIDPNRVYADNSSALIADIRP